MPWITGYRQTVRENARFLQEEVQLICSHQSGMRANTISKFVLFFRHSDIDFYIFIVCNNMMMHKCNVDKFLQFILLHRYIDWGARFACWLRLISVIKLMYWLYLDDNCYNDIKRCLKMHHNCRSIILIKISHHTNFSRITLSCFAISSPPTCQPPQNSGPTTWRGDQSNWKVIND